MGKGLGACKGGRKTGAPEIELGGTSFGKIDEGEGGGGGGAFDIISCWAVFSDCSSNANESSALIAPVSVLDDTPEPRDLPRSLLGFFGGLGSVEHSIRGGEVYTSESSSTICLSAPNSR